MDNTKCSGKTTDFPPTKYACPCCGKLTLTEPPPGSYEICGVCSWEDDAVQYRHQDLAGGANKMSLRQARESYRKHKQDTPASHHTCDES